GALQAGDPGLVRGGRLPRRPQHIGDRGSGDCATPQSTLSILGQTPARGSTQRHQPRAASPIRETFTEWRTILRLIGLGAVGAVGFYMSFVCITTYPRQIDHTAQSTALDINTIAMAVLLLLLAPVGALSDRFGRKPVLLIATGGIFLMAW